MKKFKTFLIASTIALASNSAVAEPVKYLVESNHAFSAGSNGYGVFAGWQ